MTDPLTTDWIEDDTREYRAWRHILGAIGDDWPVWAAHVWADGLDSWRWQLELDTGQGDWDDADPELHVDWLFGNAAAGGPLSTAREATEAAIAMVARIQGSERAWARDNCETCGGTGSVTDADGSARACDDCEDYRV